MRRVSKMAPGIKSRSSREASTHLTVHMSCSVLIRSTIEVAAVIVVVVTISALFKMSTNSAQKRTPHHSSTKRHQ